MSDPGIVEIVAANHVRWRVVEEAVPRLFEEREFLSPQRILVRTVLRNTRSRRIERIDLASESLLVKTYLSTPIEGLWRRLAGNAPADLEFDHGCELRRLGFNVPEPLASGRQLERLGIRESTLVTRYATGAVELLALAHDPTLGRAARGALIDAVADLVRGLHDAGVLHEDLHLGNLLVMPGTQSPTLLMIDLRRVRIGSPPDRAARAASLASLRLATHGLVSRTERFRFLKRYLRRAAAIDDTLSLAREIELRGRELIFRLARRRARSALRGDSRFQVEDAGAIRWIVRRESRTPDLRRIIEDPELASLEGFEIHRRDAGGFRERLKSLLGRSRARRWLAWSVLLESLRIPAAVVVAAGDARGGRSYVIKKTLPGTVSLAERSPPPGAVEEFASRLRAHGLVHRQLTARSFVLDSAGTLVLVDFDSLVFQTAGFRTAG